MSIAVIQNEIKRCPACEALVQTDISICLAKYVYYINIRVKCFGNVLQSSPGNSLCFQTLTKCDFT